MLQHATIMASICAKAHFVSHIYFCYYIFPFFW